MNSKLLAYKRNNDIIYHQRNDFMKKKYILIDDKAIIEDENYKKTICDYHTNINDVLIEENIVETIENNIKTLEEESEKFRLEHKERKKIMIAPIVAGILIPLVMVPILFETVFSGSSNIMVDSIFGPMSESFWYTGITTSICSLTGIGVTGVFYLEYKENEKREKGRQNVLKQLKRILEKKKDKIEELQKGQTTRCLAENYEEHIVDDKHQIQTLNEHIELYYDCGYNGKKYYNYYQKNGRLPKKVEVEYNGLGESIIQDYFEENGPTLVRKRAFKRK